MYRGGGTTGLNQVLLYGCRIGFYRFWHLLFGHTFLEQCLLYCLQHGNICRAKGLPYRLYIQVDVVFNGGVFQYLPCVFQIPEPLAFSYNTLLRHLASLL
ncbi:hypothetical protein MBAV_004444 [Candidatus Magnetobacterium bavaricum]|uniref:Uncharacterized protein n=1 Tax=Candidatus Magnetobacterium bavaricum TaxID=29290 RepID=A0A0F3GRN8_9BACT|nr:hypothetical protein MBAV_004444 [Candidatus Magnetobacterium bavaricum]